MEQKEIFEKLANVTLKSVENISNWYKAILYIERQEKSVGFKSSYLNEKEEEIFIDTEADYFTSKAVQELYKLTQSHNLTHINWNKAKFIIDSKNKIDIEYYRDENWQNEVDNLES